MHHVKNTQEGAVRQPAAAAKPTPLAPSPHLQNDLRKQNPPLLPRREAYAAARQGPKFDAMIGHTNTSRVVADGLCASVLCNENRKTGCAQHQKAWSGGGACWHPGVPLARKRVLHHERGENAVARALRGATVGYAADFSDGCNCRAQLAALTHRRHWAAPGVPGAAKRKEHRRRLVS